MTILVLTPTHWLLGWPPIDHEGSRIFLVFILLAYFWISKNLFPLKPYIQFLSTAILFGLSMLEFPIDSLEGLDKISLLLNYGSVWKITLVGIGVLSYRIHSKRILMQDTPTTSRLRIGCKVLFNLTLILTCGFLLEIVAIFDKPGSYNYLNACSAKLDYVGKLLKIYRSDYGDLPKSLQSGIFSKVAPKVHLPHDTNGLLICPDSELSYVYHPEPYLDPNLPICWDPQPHAIQTNAFNFIQRRNILFADGHVQYYSEAKFQQIIKNIPAILEKDKEALSPRSQHND